MPSLWGGGVPDALVSGIRVDNRLTYSKEIRYLPLRLGKNVMLLEAHDHGYKRQIRFPTASIVTV